MISAEHYLSSRNGCFARLRLCVIMNINKVLYFAPDIPYNRVDWSGKNLREARSLLT